MNSERETQFLAALLDCGQVPNIRYVLEFGGMMCTATQRSEAQNMYRKHKVELLKHLLRADYFDVQYDVPGSRNDPLVHKVLTEKAALWIGEFYQWMLKQQAEAMVLHSV